MTNTNRQKALNETTKAYNSLVSLLVMESKKSNLSLVDTFATYIPDIKPTVTPTTSR